MIMLTALLFGCDYIDETFNSIDTSKIKAQSLQDASGIQWEAYDKSLNAVASINDVKFECIKNYNVSDTSKSKRREYDIAVTADITYNIFKDYINHFNASVIFEAMSKSGVVLGASKGTTALVSNATNTTVSAKILGLSPEEMKKVTNIIARWDFER
jgi:hypothetical protein